MVPQTGNYMIAGYIVILGGMALYVISLFARFRRRLQELSTLEEEIAEE
jgi:hypothetical protein